MQMYVNYFDRYEKVEDENPTIGILLNKQSDEVLVNLTLPENAGVISAIMKATGFGSAQKTVLPTGVGLYRGIGVQYARSCGCGQDGRPCGKGNDGLVKEWYVETVLFFLGWDAAGKHGDKGKCA